MAVGDQVRAELERLNALETVEGEIALRLAEQLDAPRNGMAVAGDAKELRVVMATIRERQPVKADPIDELNARRQGRGSTSEAV
jgi:hypothetical protein